ncbi:unnamed protein product, partial [Pleuronectes platessa]
MGLIYEFSTSSSTTADEISQLPGLAADMLLDGYPLELLDGDASNVPERWVTAVLMELHKKVGQRSRLLVLTVLGVQSTGKSTLLNTMFGVQFPVSSGRCTRGAFMLFLKVAEDLKSELNCDFIVLIDTEGLKAPDLAQLEDSYEHDNQLATFVIGLSDATIINIAMENSAEMKDVLQIAVHAFLRMKEIGKKPVCHFVHQNVSSVSAHDKNITDRKHLLDQLNEMTQIAAEMEKKPSIKEFTDVLDYDMDKNNWNIPGLWHGTPPMAPVNTGYSEAVADFKKNLLQTVKKDPGNEVSQIPEFLEWMKSLWQAVKYENFIFSFRNTLLAQAYDNLCKEFNQWEWEFRKEILTWQTQAEVEILNADNESDVETWERLVGGKKSEVLDKITNQQTKMRKQISDYYKMKGKRVHLIEKYKQDFLNSVKGLGDEIKHSVWAKLDCTLELKLSLKKVQDIQRGYRGVIEQKVMKLLGDCKASTLTEEQLTQEFEKMWAEATGNLSGLRERDIAACVLKQLRKDFCNRNVNEALQKVTDLKEMGTGPFKTRPDHVDTFMQKLQHLWEGNLQTESLTLLQGSHSAEYSSRTIFQYNIQKELLQQEDFKSFVSYIDNYEIYVKDWIFQQILQKMSEDKTLCKLKNNNLQVIDKKISEAIDPAAIGEDGAPLPDNKESITKLISNMRKHLIKDISLSVEAEKTTLFQIQSSCHSFIKCLKSSMKELKEQLEEEFSNSGDITETLNTLPIKPQDELFKRVFGCGEQCPFCKAPCEAGGKEHKQHHAAIHRPKGLGNFNYKSSMELVDSLCTTEVHSDRSFRNTDTKWEVHPYKDYNKYYPDWIIPPDPTIEASDYWKGLEETHKGTSSEGFERRLQHEVNKVQLNTSASPEGLRNMSGPPS